MLSQLFWTFLLIGFASYGGGYAMLPAIELEALKHHWMTARQLADVIAIAGMAPGPAATNSAIVTGYEIAGLPGAVVSALAMVIPSLLLALLVAAWFYRVYQNRLVQSAFYGLRPVVAGLVFYAAIRFAAGSVVTRTLSWQNISFFLIFLLALLSLFRLRLHPLLVILLSGMLGVVFYG